MNYFNYLKYLMKHKYYVWVACNVLGVSWYQALIHDISKFRLREWCPYMNCFYNHDGSSCYKETIEFAQAWNAHQKYNKHHYQYWLLTWDNGKSEPLPMPEKYVREMMADWFGAGKAITGKWEAEAWYIQNQDNIMLHPDTKAMVLSLFKRIQLRRL